MNLVAFDLGASGGKVMLGRYDGRRLALTEAHRFENGPVPINGGLYWDIVGIYRQLRQGLQKACAAAEVHSMGIDSFSNDFGLIDGGGELISPVRCYRDDRTARHASYIYDRLSPETLYKLTGNQNARFNTLMQLGAMQAAGQGYLLERAHKLLFVPDLLIHFLTGEETAEYTLSSVSQMYSFSRQSWCGEVLGALGLDRRLFGSLSAPGSAVGSIRSGVAREIGAGGLQVVSVCEHDTASAFLASPSVSESRAVISGGTWSLMGCELDSALITDAGYRYNIANEGGYPGHHRFLRNVMGSWIIQEIRADYRSAGETYTYAELEAAAADAPAFAFLIDVDDDIFFSPGQMCEKVRGFCRKLYGRQPETTGALLRCVYESLAMKYRRTLDILEELTGAAFTAVSIVGGGSKDSLLCKLTASACGRPVAAGPAEATALGNMMVQLLSAGELSSVEEGRAMITEAFPLRWYEPANTAVWNEQYQLFLGLFPDKAEENRL